MSGYGVWLYSRFFRFYACRLHRRLSTLVLTCKQTFFDSSPYPTVSAAFKPPQTRLLAIISLALSSLVGCVSSGPMDLQEVSYLAVPSGNNINFYRITVIGDTDYGESNYNSGWFPAEAVDQLYGSSSDTNAGDVIKTQEDIQRLYNSAILETTRNYLDAAKNHNKSEAVIQKHLIAQRRVRAIAGDGIELPEGAVEVEYDPSRNLVVRHTGQKRVFVLASDPDKVINSISRFAGDQKTSATVLRLADVVRQQNQNSVDEANAQIAVEQQTNSLIVSQINAALEKLKDANLSQADLLTEVEALVLLVENAK